MTEPFTVLQFSSANLFRALSNKYCLPDDVADQTHANYVYRYLDAIGAKTIVIEYYYTDGDYLEDFASYYVRCHEPYERCCKRLHFFSEELTADSLRNLVLRETAPDRADTLRRSYLGFLVARPLP